MDGKENNSQIWKRRVMQRSAGDQVSFRCTAWSTDSSVQTVVVQIQIRPTSHRGIFWRCLEDAQLHKFKTRTNQPTQQGWYWDTFLPLQAYGSKVQISYIYAHQTQNSIMIFIWNPRLERAEAEDGSSYWAAATTAAVGGAWDVGAVKVSVKGFSR